MDENDLILIEMIKPKTDLRKSESNAKKADKSQEIKVKQQEK